MRLVNLTSHPVTLFDTTGHSVTIPSQGPESEVRVRAPANPLGLLRLEGQDLEESSARHSGDKRGRDISLISRELEISGLPVAQHGILFIVSQRAAHAAWKSGRMDVVHPGEALKKNNEIVGSTALVVSPESLLTRFNNSSLTRVQVMHEEHNAWRHLCKELLASKAVIPEELDAPLTRPHPILDAIRAWGNSLVTLRSYRARR